MKKLLLVSTLLVTACAQVSPEYTAQTEAYNSCKRFTSFTKRADCVEGISKTDNVLYQKDPYFTEFVDYSGVLAEQIRAKKITEKEARFAFSSRLAEVTNRQGQLQAAQQANQISRGAALMNYSNQLQQQQMMQQQINNANRPVNTNCFNTGVGVSCNSY